MAATATVRELRNHFPRVRKLVETEGEVVVTEQGTPKYRLTQYRPAASRKSPPRKDYLARLRRHQPHSASADEAAALREANRGSR
jgi:antitoxin (DNA-binding transcriptional repressor) of toxin-antitoxin stability system